MLGVIIYFYFRCLAGFYWLCLDTLVRAVPPHKVLNSLSVLVEKYEIFIRYYLKTSILNSKYKGIFRVFTQASVMKYFCNTDIKNLIVSSCIFGLGIKISVICNSLLTII